MIDSKIVGVTERGDLSRQLLGEDPRSYKHEYEQNVFSQTSLVSLKFLDSPNEFYQKCEPMRSHLSLHWMFLIPQFARDSGIISVLESRLSSRDIGHFYK